MPQPKLVQLRHFVSLCSLLLTLICSVEALCTQIVGGNSWNACDACELLAWQLSNTRLQLLPIQLFFTCQNENSFSETFNRQCLAMHPPTIETLQALQQHSLHVTPFSILPIISHDRRCSVSDRRHIILIWSTESTTHKIIFLFLHNVQPWMSDYAYPTKASMQLNNIRLAHFHAYYVACRFLHHSYSNIISILVRTRNRTEKLIGNKSIKSFQSASTETRSVEALCTQIVGGNSWNACDACELIASNGRKVPQPKLARLRHFVSLCSLLLTLVC